MGYFKDLFNAFIGKTTTQTPTGMEMYGYGQYEMGYSKKTELLTEMKGWTFACVSAIADELAKIELKLYKRNKDKVEEIKESPILDVLYKVNDFTTKFDLFWLVGAYLELTGEAPLFLERDSQGVTDIYFLRPDRITPLADKEKIIRGYDYDVGRGKKIFIPPEDLIFLKFPNPARPFRGLGTLEAAARTVDIDNYAEIWNRNFFKNAARPDSILTVDQPQMTDQQKKVLKQSIKEEYEGVEKSHKLMVLFGNMKLDKFAVNQKDMDFNEQQKFTRDKIFGIFRVPKAIVAQTEGVNFASAKVAQYVFARWTIQPKMERIIQMFNEFFLPLFTNSENLYLDFVNPIPEDEEAKLNYYSKAVNQWMTINEVRDKEDLPPIDNGDEIYLPFNLTSIGNAEKMLAPPKLKVKKKKELNVIPGERFKQLKARSVKKFKQDKKIEEKKEEVKEKVKDMLRKELKNDGDDKQWDNHKKQIFWLAKDEIFRKYVALVRNKQKQIFKEQRKAVLAKLKESKAVEKKIDVAKLQLDKTKEAERTVVIVLPVLEELFKESADKTFEFLDVEMTMDTTTPEIQKLLKSDCRKFAKAATTTTNIAIKNQISEGLRLDEGIPDLKERVNRIFDNAETFRSERIARTESIRYNNAAAQQAYEDSGVVEAKEWLVEPDACEFCAPMAGKIVDLKDSFFKEGDTATGAEGGRMDLDYGTTEYPPLHPMCRCHTAPILIE